jgi:hypothetical protein
MALRDSPGAPATALSPEKATDRPKKSLAAPSEAMSLVCGLQVLPLRSNT